MRVREREGTRLREPPGPRPDRRRVQWTLPARDRTFDTRRPKQSPETAGTRRAGAWYRQEWRLVALGALTPAIARAVPDAALRRNGSRRSGRVDWREWSVCGSGAASPGPCVADESPGGERVTLAGRGACALPGGTPQTWKGPALSGEGGSGAAIRSRGTGRGPDARGARIRRDPGGCGNRAEGYGAGVRCSAASVNVGRFRASCDSCDARVVFTDGVEPGPVSACGIGKG